jgi:ABC-type spermidine/putrescine transport system permease subunit I
VQLDLRRRDAGRRRNVVVIVIMIVVMIMIVVVIVGVLGVLARRGRLNGALHKDRRV